MNRAGGFPLGLRFPWAVSAAVALVVLLAALAAPASRAATPAPSVTDLLSRYAHAIDNAGVPDLERYVVIGTLAGEGLTGTFRSWHDGERDRDDQTLGPRSESIVQVGERIYMRDANEDVRELRGVLLRRAKTERFINSGEFARRPDRSTYRGTARIGGLATFLLEVSPVGGQPETLYLDAESGLPARIAYDDDDGRTTVDLGDWRSVNGHRFPFHVVVSNGDHEFDLTETTTAIDPSANIPAGTFEPPRSRAIEMAAPETLPLTLRESHLYVPVSIAGVTYTFLIDTGAANVLVDARVARAAQLHEEGTLEASGSTRTGGLHVAKLADLAIGSAHLRDLVVSTIDLGGATSGAFRIDGILGYPFFASATVRIDYAKSTMTFGPPGSLPPSGARLDLELDRALPEATLRLNGDVDGQFVVDTGDAAEMLLYRPFIDRYPGVVPYSDSTRRSYGLGGPTSSYRTSLDRLDIGGSALYHTEVDVMQATSGAFADRFTAGNIGLGLLKKFVVTFDESAGALYLERGALFDDGRDRVR
jgi:hypothetical protein